MSRISGRKIVFTDRNPILLFMKMESPSGVLSITFSLVVSIN